MRAIYFTFGPFKDAAVEDVPTSYLRVIAENGILALMSDHETTAADAAEAVLLERGES